MGRPAPQTYVVTKPDKSQVHAHVLERRAHEAYVHYVDTDRRLDEWVSEGALQPLSSIALRPADGLKAGSRRLRPIPSRTLKRDRDETVEELLAENVSTPVSQSDTDIPLDEEEKDMMEHKRITAKRNYHKVIFGQWQMKTWYFSPYPLGVDDHTASASLRMISGAAPSNHASRATDSAGENLMDPRPPTRPHVRTADILAGGLNNKDNEDVTLWVCDKCFKYMKEGASWELHVRNCNMLHPPGRKVYQRGAHTIWEVDGALQKLYCQNLSLFGKFFIDVKTLFYDCENFMFYVLTDAESRRDHVLGFFSKEKASYDDYNLACIVILPPYQKKGYGMLLIEFSYELSRDSPRFGTPERPLSDLGLRSYVTYWISVLVRFFRKVLTVTPHEATEAGNDVADPGRLSVRKKKRAKGFDGEVPEVLSDVPQGSYIALVEEPTFGSLRTTHTTISPIDGSATTHLSVRCTLMDIAKATNIRPDDVAFALRECGFLQHVKTGDGVEQETMVISREMVERIAKERNVKRMCLDVAHILL